MKNYRTELSQRVRYAIIAGMAGTFLIPQVGYAGPTGEHGYTPGVDIQRPDAVTTTITATAQNNVINWRDYSVNHGETVQYDGGVTTGAETHNYLNIVTGANTSNINGKIKGGNNVYIVNPNGVIFGKGAEVNVGHLHVSTQEKATLNEGNFTGSGASPLANTAALQADVVNMGKITATSVEVYGAHIRFLNAADVTTNGTTLAPVTVHTAAPPASATSADGGYAHIGYRGTAPTNYTSGTTGVSPEYYQLVANKAELDAINTDTTTLAGNYMLEQDIDLGGVAHTPIGGNSAPGAFTGKFDGNFFRVQNFNVSNVNSAGLFGEVSNGRIENLGVAQANIVGKRDNSHQYAGGIVGHTAGTSILKNVYATDNIKVEGRRGLYGGIVGSTGSATSGGSDHTVIDSAYSKAVLGRDNPGTTALFTGGGIVGHSGNTTDISNSYSAAKNTDGTAAYFLYIADPDDKTTVKNSYGVVGTEFSSNENSFSSTTAINTYKINGTRAEKIGATGDKDAYASKTYSDSNWSINNDGAPGAKWRIYEGRTLPLLTAFMGVSSETTYNYRYFDGAKQPSADTGNTAKSNGGKDITAEYNSYYLKIVNGSNSPGGKANAQFGAGADTSKVIDYIGTDQDFDRTNGIRNAGTKAILWSDQDGPNLRGVNVTITPRDVRLNGGKINPKRMYNGKSDVTKAFIDALTSGDVSSSGFTQEDIKAGTVALDFDTGHFKAQMADKNVGTDKTVTFSGTIGFTGTDKDNYTFDGSSLSTLQGKATITKAPLYLAIAKKRADDKIYDGTSTVTDSAMLQSGSPPNITLDKSKTGLTLAQINAGTPAMPDGAIMTGDDDTTKDNVDITSVGGPKYTNAAGTEQFHAGDHKLRYTGVGLTGTDAGNYELYYTPENGTKTEITDGNVYLDGKIIPRQILRDSFNIYDKTTHAQKTVQRVYNGNDEYTPGSDVYLSSNASASGNTGIVDRDRNHITFALTGTGHFTQADGTTRTKNVSNAAKVAYTVTGKTDDADLYRLSDYYIMEGTTRKSLGDTFNATGAGKITPKVLTATVQNNHIEKTYDAKQNHTDGNRNDITGEALVKLEGFVGRESRANTSTANYASQNVDWDTATRTEKAQAVTYTASFDRGTGAESDNYTLDTTGTTVLASQTVAGSYTGTIKQRDLGLTFGNVTKIYDGTTTNATKTVTRLNDGLSGAVTGADGTTVASLSGLSNVTSQYADRHAGTNKRVEYNSLSDVLGSNHNYKIADKQYGTGTITRRLIESSGFQVRKKDGTIANATKVYDGTDKFTLEDGTYLVAKTAASATTPNTGVVDVDKDNIYFTMTGNEGHFLKGDTGTDRTSHVSEAERVGYSIAAGTKDGGVSPLSNYYFGEAYTPEDQRRNLEDVKGTDPRDAVTATGSITPASIRATTKEISKVYDGMREHTDGNRTEIKDDTVVTFTGWVSGQTRDNTSTALYADRNVSRDSSGNVIKKNVDYTAQLTGQYADDYQIVNDGGTVISTATGTGDAKTVTANLGTVTDAGKITPRKLNIKMGDVTKTYDGKSTNTSSAVTEITDVPQTSVIGTILGGDSITTGALKTAWENKRSGGTASSSYGNGTGSAFRHNANASNGTPHDVRYTKMDEAFKDAFGTTTAGNYTVDQTVYGKGTINRRLIEKSGFQVRDKDGNIADATKVYDGTSVFALKNGETLVAKTATTGSDTGVVDKDKDNIYFTMTGENGHFTSDVAGVNRTSHKSEAAHVAYNVIAGTKNRTTSPLSNYSFGTSDTSKRDLENVNAANPDAVTAKGSITPAKIQAQTKEITKVYDGWKKHTDGNRKEVTGDSVVSFTGWVEHDGTVERRTNSSTATYANENVARDGSGKIIKKAVNYTAQITGKYADDYQIVDAGNNVISNVSGTGDSKTVTATRNNVADMGTITPRKLNIKMDDVTKIYDGKSTNTSSTVTEITDVPQTSVIGTILDGDSITTGALKTAWENKRSGGTASSSYGNGTGSAFRHNANASNGTPHDVRYTKMDEAFKDAFGAAADNYTVDEDVYGKGTISRKAIDPNNFDIVDAHGHASHATKVYDGTSDYTVPSGWKLQPSTGSGTGVVDDDADKIKFAIDPNKGAHFTKADNTTRTANAYEATRVAYNVKATADNSYEYLLKNYTLNGQNLESGNATATGAGTITRRTINVGLAEASGIDKVYDGNANLIDTANRHHQVFSDDDGRANVGYATGTTNANKLVRTKNGYSVDDSAQVTVQGSYADKNVAYSSGAVTTKNITYNVKIAGNLGRNYLLSDGITTVNAENGMNLSATGKITPKDLSGALKKVTKVYDGTKNVPASQVGLESGLNGVVSGDTVTLGSHTESFQSENVNGDGTTETLGGTAQKNWVNYSNLTLSGTDAGNYTLASTAKGLGEITPYQLNDSSITFTKTRATKVYDGTRDVKWTDGSSTTTDQKKYITSATVTVGSAPAVDILGDLKLEEAKYDTKDVDGGNATDRVTYKLSYTGTNGNFSLGTGVTSFTTKGDGVITKKDVTATVRNPLSKTYDATTVVKNAAGNVITGSALNDQVSLSGLTGNDGATYTTTAVYADKNAGTGKTVNYTLAIDGANAGNYNLKYNGADNAGAFSTNNNTITKRNVNVQFKNPPARTYNGSAENTAINPFVSSADAAVLRKDKATLISGTDVQNLTGIASKYVQKEDRVTEDPNAGKDKLVRFDNVRTAMNNALGADASNYEFNETSYAKGTINKANIDTSKITFRTSGATKTYDGTDRVKYNGSSAPGVVKNYITEATADLGGGHTADLRGDLKIDENATRYESSNAGTGIRVTYKFHLNNSNIEISGTNEFEMHDTGEIKRRVLNLGLAQKSGIDKIYDATDKVHNTDERHYDAFVDHDAKGNVTYAAGTTEDTKLVRKDGAPETTVKVTAKYADENAGAKNVNYTAQIEGDAGRNYTLKYGATEGDADTGINFDATGTIAKRKLTLGFDKASKQYDTEADNPDKKKLISAIPDDRDARGDDTLKRDGILAADGTVNTGAFDTTHVASEYGTRSNDPAHPFTPDPNVGQKDVRYTNVKSALSGAKAGNYDIEDTVYGTGEITRAKIKAADFDFQIDPSKKTYDGTTTVYWKDKEGQWQEAKGEEGLDGAKKYYFGDRSTVKLANGNRVKANPKDFSLTAAAYQNKNVAGGTETWTDANGNTHRNWVNYKLHINTTNFDVEGELDTTRKGVGTITKRDLATMLPKHLIKEYDGKQTFDETNRDYVNALANQNITHIVEGDRDKVQLKVKGTYSDKNASAETKADAQNGVHLSTAPNGRTVDYKLTLSGDAATLDNYTIGGQPTTNTVTGKADIYKKTLTVGVDNIDKLYDGTRTVVRPNGTGTLPHPEVGKLHLDGFVDGEGFGFDQTAADKVNGQYSDENVSRAVDGSIQDKDISYSGFKNAFADNATRDMTGQAQNYRLDSDTAAGKGKILPRPISPDEITNNLVFNKATKVYDGTRAVKYNGQSTTDALKNYLASAKVNINGTEIDIKKDLTIKADEADTHYDSPNVAGSAQPRVTYGLRYIGSNFDISGDLTKTADGVITKRRVTAYAPGQLVKWYDGTEKVYDPLDNSIKTYRRNDMSTPVTVGEKIVRLSTQRGDTGLLNEHKDKNLSYAVYKGKDAGTGKEVTHYVKLADDVAGNYEVVNTRGEAIAQLKTKNNEIRKRRLDITFDHVRKPYDASPENRDVTAFVKNSDAQATLRRDGVDIFEDELNLQDADGNALVSSQYGYGSTDDSFTADANAGEKSVQYSGLGDALRNSVLGENAKNYDFDETGYGTGTIDKAKVRARDFDLRFDPANKEYDGTANVLDPLKQLNKGRSHIAWERHGRSKYNMPDTDIASITGTYVGTDGREDKNAGERKQVNYRVKLNDRNFDFVGGWDGVIKGEGGGTISKRKIIAAAPRYLTKEYDGTTDVVNRARDAEGNLIKGNGDALIGFRHADDTTKSALLAGDDVRNESTASYSDSNVAWKDRAWKNGHGTVDDMDVNYTLGLSGADSSNYEIVNPDGKTVGKGKITPKEIHLKSDPQTRWINEGLPDKYTGTPTGKGYKTGVNGEALPGEIYYASPDGRLRWGDYHINGYYRASDKAQYQRPDGTRYQLADGTYDGDSVARNYRFVQDPANATALHIGPYVPDTDYYQALTQTSKMLPDEYAYENASLDRRSHFGRDPEAEISYEPPSLNMVKDGVDISKNGIEITDETVFRLVNEVFG